ncbi:MAG: Asp-tRNA(Asn)/Glu-tRNA(Gln) amidotransferase subunit GatA [Bacteroidota bacterium]|nr:Asp-tRNA(Asn)/Glu-tRNA(Gln) amidotransferase subunit GatA [Bacteroidota bacterium]
MNYNSLSAIHEDVKAGKTRFIDIVNHHLERIESNKDLNVFLEVYAGEARQRATVIDQKIKHGTAGKLAGMVVAIKDNICYKDHVVSAGSKILENFQSLFSATVVERLLAEDAIIIGRTNCDEFAMGSSNETSYYGPVKNPLDPTRTPGGSSGGSAAAVAAGMCQLALGSDTGGSIRQPASFCGIYGYKPTYGMVSRWGLIAYASSFDQIGPLGKSAEDIARVMEVIAGPDEYDSTLSQKPVPNFTEAISRKGTKRIAYLKDCLEAKGLDPEVKAHMEEMIEKLRNAGHTVEPVEFPYLDYLVPIYYVITTAEASSNLARFDGIHYGYRSENATDLESTYKLSRSEGFGTEVQRRIMLGTFVLSSGYYDAYFGKGQKARRFILNKTREIFADYDLILSPTSPHTAFPLDQEYPDPTVMYLEDIFTVQANICGTPAVSIPTGTHSNGLPFGVQLMADSFQDEMLMSFADELSSL